MKFILPVLLFFSVVSTLSANSTTELQQTISEGTLSVDITDLSQVPIANPKVVFTTVDFSFSCQSAGPIRGYLGTSTNQIYIQNPDAADGGWTVSIAATSTDALWTSTSTPSHQFDYNDPLSSGCQDGPIDTDSAAGQMFVSPFVFSNIATGTCASCSTTGVSMGALKGFTEGTNDSITVVTGSGSSDDIGDWIITGVLFQTVVPPEQPAHDDYVLEFILSIVAS